jgi:uncharacterized phage-like protein YoqJ
MKLSDFDTVKSVCFTGHRELGAEEEYYITNKLTDLLTELTENHELTNCYAGGAVGLDTVAAKVVLSLKNAYPQLKLNLILPCQGQEKSWNAEQTAAYNSLKAQADSVRILAPFYYNGCMQARNKVLLESSDLCIAYLRAGTSSGGSLNTVLQAAKLGIPIINLADKESEDI